jgi:hypothetical protein
MKKPLSIRRVRHKLKHQQPELKIFISQLIDFNLKSVTVLKLVFMIASYRCTGSAST